jgi:hypothetical protein
VNTKAATNPYLVTLTVLFWVLLAAAAAALVVFFLPLGLATGGLGLAILAVAGAVGVLVLQVRAIAWEVVRGSAR